MGVKGTQNEYEKKVNRENKNIYWEREMSIRLYLRLYCLEKQ